MTPCDRCDQEATAHFQEHGWPRHTCWAHFSQYLDELHERVEAGIKRREAERHDLVDAEWARPLALEP